MTGGVSLYTLNEGGRSLQQPSGSQLGLQSGNEGPLDAAVCKTAIVHITEMLCQCTFTLCHPQSLHVMWASFGIK